MWWKLIFNSFRRDPRKKAIAISAVALATCLATFLLNWSLNLGDKIQRDLRAYGANILITPQGDSLPLVVGRTEAGFAGSDRFLNTSDIGKIRKIFWTNQIVAFAPVLPWKIDVSKTTVTIVGTEFGEKTPEASLPRTAPYLSLMGRWPASTNEVVIGRALSEELQLRKGDTVPLNEKPYRVVGVVRSGGPEDRQIIAQLQTVQTLSGHPGQFKQLLVSAMVTPQNQLYRKYQRNPNALSPKEFERYSCTPYITSVALDISKVFPGSEPRILRQISQSEEKISRKVNWLMLLVTLAALAASSLTMTSTTTAMILERRKELSLMKAIGSRNSFIVFYLFAEILLLGIAGSLVGYGLGSFLSLTLSKSVFQDSLQLKGIVFPVVGCVGILIICCGSVWPLRRAIALDPAVALKDL